MTDEAKQERHPTQVAGNCPTCGESFLRPTDVKQELGEVAASIYTALCKACPKMQPYPVGIVEPHLAALRKHGYDQGYYDGYIAALEARGLEIREKNDD